MDRKKSKQDPNVDRIRGFFALLTALLVMIGQVILYTTTVSPDVVMPVSLWLCIAGVILFILNMAIRPPRFLQVLFSKLPFTWMVSWVTAAVILSLLATLSSVLYERAGRTNFLTVIALWFSAAMCYLTAFSNGISLNIQWRPWLKTHRNELIAVGAVTLLAFAFRFYQLGSTPRVINGDEGRMGIVAEMTTSGPYANPFALWDNFGTLYLQAINLMFQFFGATAFSLRLLSAIGGVLAIPAVYLLARQIGGPRVALIAASLLAFSHTHIHFSRTAAVGYIQATWLVPLELFLLLSGLEKRSSLRTALAGVILAIHFSIYITAQIVAAMVFVYMLVILAFFWSWFKAVGRQFLAFWGGFVIMLIPEATYVWQHPNEFFARLGADGTFQSGWLAETMANTGQNALQVLGGRVLHAFLVLIYYPSIDFYGSSAPMLTLIAAALFLIGLGISLWRTRSRGFLLLNGYFWGITLATGIFAIPPSADSYRMLSALPAAIVLAAVGLDQVLELAGLGWKKSRLAYSVVTSVILVSLLTTNLWTYYVDFAGRCLYADNFQGRFASYLGSYARKTKPEDTIYLLSDDIYFYGSHASVDFLSNKRPIINVPAPADTLSAAAGEVIVANPNRFDELKAWAAAHPGGELKYVYDCTSLIMVVYQFP